MKNFEHYVCTFEQAKQLNELGVKKESCFYWTDGFNNLPEITLFEVDKCYSAFTSQDLCELIVEYIDKHNLSEYCECELVDEAIHLEIQPKDRENNIGYLFYSIRLGTSEFDPYDGDHVYIFELYAETEAIARAEFLIYLFKNKCTKNL